MRVVLRALCVATGAWCFRPPQRLEARPRGLARRGAGEDEEARASFGGLRLLEWLPSQQLLVKTAKWGTGFAWRTMMSELAPQSPEGGYVRPNSQRGGARAEVVADLADEAGRYVLYAGNACPWCHRTTLAVALREAEALVAVVALDDDPTRARRGGWTFSEAEPDPVFGAPDLKGVYDACAPDGAHVGRVTAPLLVDRKLRCIVSNESGDIVRALVSHRGTRVNDRDLRPPDLAAAVDELNDFTYEQINNGVYRAGFATRQGPYEAAEKDVHEGLAKCDDLLSRQPFLAGDVLTEADLRLLPTVDRFDACYGPLFRCGRKTIARDYAHVDAWRRRLRTLPNVAASVDVADAARSYFGSLFPLNPSGIVPVAPDDDDAPCVPGLDLAACTRAFSAA